MTCNHSQCETPFCPWCGRDPFIADFLAFCERMRELQMDGSEPQRIWNKRVEWVNQQLQRNREAGR